MKTTIFTTKDNPYVEVPENIGTIIASEGIVITGINLYKHLNEVTLLVNTNDQVKLDVHGETIAYIVYAPKEGQNIEDYVHINPAVL